MMDLSLSYRLYRRLFERVAVGPMEAERGEDGGGEAMHVKKEV